MLIREGLRAGEKFLPGETNAFNIKELFASLKGNKFYDELYNHFTILQTADAGRDFNSFLAEYKTCLAETECSLNEENFEKIDRLGLEQEKKDLEQVIAGLEGVLDMLSSK